MDNLRETLITSLPRTAPRTIKTLRKLGIETFFDLLHYFPYRYEDYSRVIAIRGLPKERPFVEQELDMDNTLGLISSGKVSIKGTIASFKNVYTRRGFVLQQSIIEDATGTLNVTWFNQAYLSSMLKPGYRIWLAGKVRLKAGVPELQPETFEILNETSVENAESRGIVPVYHQTTGISSKTIRDKASYIVRTFAHKVEDFLPPQLIKKYELIPAAEAYQQIHFPKDKESLLQARRRIGFDEVFVLQLSSHMIKKEWQEEKVGQQLHIEEHKRDIDSFIASLPFSLTSSQEKAYKEILQDLDRSIPMNRLLQGDVGSGKTVVAAIAAYLVHLNSCKTLFMAPTEILAQQHYATLTKLFKGTGMPKVTLITGKIKPSTKDVDESGIIVGTHALVSSKALFERVGLVVVDEQHKFGVAQRAALKQKGVNPHLLSMTATPIPRTVTLTLYGELDISVIDEMPKGRIIVKTHLVPPNKRDKGYSWIADQIAKNKEQAFIICPFVDESETETLKNVKAVKVEYEHLSKSVFPKLKLGLLHGKLKSTEKDEIMKQFNDGSLDILVSTPVVEVGIDVPNATMIVIEGAERFGLAQLHQLRGRVGRSDKQSYCFLFESEQSESNNSRLTYFEKEHSGFKLAYFDLKHRGGGALFGTQQHGASDIKVAALDNVELIEESSAEAKNFIETKNIHDFPELLKRITLLDMKRIARN